MVSLIDTFLLWFAVGVPIVVGMIVAKILGPLPGLGAGLVSAMVCICGAVLFHRANGLRKARLRRELAQKYRRIYRVIAVPTDDIRKPQSAEIRVGDYGWEAVPLSADGLIYLQGLNAQWRVVWYAGFRSHQIENAALKPQSQYDWDYTWVRNPPLCPFPVQKRLTSDMGLPIPVKTKT